MPVRERRTWYLMTNSVVALWLVATGVVVIIHRFISYPTWLMVHLMLLGAVSSAIIIWSQHFADTLLRSQAIGGRLSLGIRLGVHSIGAITVVAGIVSELSTVTLVGAIIVVTGIIVHAVILSLQMRRSLPSRFKALVRYYVAAAVCLVVGVGLGFWMSSVGSNEPLHDRLFVAHIGVNLLGWIGLTVMGTVILLWPTVLHARVRPGVEKRADIALVAACGGVILILIAALVGFLPVIALGATVWLCALAVLAIDGIAQARDVPPSTYAAWSIGAAICWLAVSVAFLAVGIGGAPSWSEGVARLAWLVQPFIAGFVVQVLLGALSFLLPVVLAGGPSPSKAASAELDRGALFRIVVINGGIIVYLLPVTSTVRVVVSVVVFAAFLSFLVFAVRSIIVGRRVRREEAEHPSQRVRTVPKRERTASQRALTYSARTGSIAAAVAVLVVAAAVGVAIDPAAAGIDARGSSTSASTVTPTGKTTTLSVSVEGMRFTPDEFKVPVGNTLVVHFSNTGDTVHDLTFANDTSSGRLFAGQNATVNVGVITEDMDAWCSVAGHRLAGMVAKVVAVGASPSGSSAHEHKGSGDESGPSAADRIDLAKKPSTDFAPWDPALKPAPSATVHKETFTITDEVKEVAPGVRQTLWTYNGTAPGPVLRGHVGDVFEITLVNDGNMGHSIDFHAGSLSPDKPMRTIEPGESLKYTFTAERAGIWLYHCSTSPMSAHIANGMYGAVIIDPPGLDKVDAEYVIIQSDMYLGAQDGEVDAEKTAEGKPDLVVFNGYANQYVYDPVKATTGDRVRIWVMDAGPNTPSSFHVVGSQFDTVWSEGDYLLKNGGSTGVGGSQALALQPAQGGFVELTFPEAGHYSFITHIMSDAERGAKGVFEVTGPERK